MTVPIHPSVAYAYNRADDLEAVFAGQKAGHIYRRYSNPSTAAFESAMAALEGGEAGYATASCMAAIHGALLAAGGAGGGTCGRLPALLRRDVRPLRRAPARAASMAASPKLNDTWRMSVHNAYWHGP